MAPIPLKPEQRRLYQQTLKDRADWQRGDAERERAGNQAMAEWQECQKHHPEMRLGNPCPEPLTTYSYAVPATR